MNKGRYPENIGFLFGRWILKLHPYAANEETFRFILEEPAPAVSGYNYTGSVLL